MPWRHFTLYIRRYSSHTVHVLFHLVIFWLTNFSFGVTWPWGLGLLIQQITEHVNVVSARHWWRGFVRLFSVLGQEIGWEERLRNDIFLCRVRRKTFTRSISQSFVRQTSEWTTADCSVWFVEGRGCLTPPPTGWRWPHAHWWLKIFVWEVGGERRGREKGGNGRGRTPLLFGQIEPWLTVVDLQVRVKIVEARQLAGANISPISRVHCHKQAIQTRIKHSTNSPFWNETFFFSYRLPPAELFGASIEFQVTLDSVLLTTAYEDRENETTNIEVIRESWKGGRSRHVDSIGSEDPLMHTAIYIGCQWRNFFIPMYASSSGRHHVGQGNINILQHLGLQSDRRRSGASAKLFLNLPVHFYSNNVANLNRLNSQSTTSYPTTWRSYRDHRLQWSHFTYTGWIFSRSATCKYVPLLSTVNRPKLLNILINAIPPCWFRTSINVKKTQPKSKIWYCLATNRHIVNVLTTSLFWFFFRFSCVM